MKTFEDFVKASRHPQSQNLKIERFEIKEYSQNLTGIKEYSFHMKTKVSWRNMEIFELNPRRFDFSFSQDPNVGWKVHLNVSPNYSRKVSDYLFDKGFFHKFLSGGSPEDGKVFTVYFGTFTMCLLGSREIAKDLFTFLAKPLDHTEIEIAPKVVGRFACRNNSRDFSPYGFFGIVISREYDKQYLALLRKKDFVTEMEAGQVDAESQEYKTALEISKKSFEILKEKFGSNFLP